MIKVYDLHDDECRVRAMQERTLERSKPFMRTKWGLVGSPEWWESIKNNNLIHSIEGRISRVYMSGHSDYPEFKVSDGQTETSWTREGEDRFYVVGAMVRIEYVYTEETICASLSPDSKTSIRIWIQEPV